MFFVLYIEVLWVLFGLFFWKSYRWLWHSWNQTLRSEYKSFKTEEEAYAYIGNQLSSKVDESKKETRSIKEKITTTKEISPKKEKGIEVKSNAKVQVISSYIEPSKILEKFLSIFYSNIFSWHFKCTKLLVRNKKEETSCIIDIM